MNASSKILARPTADQVLAGIDLSGRHYLVTGCDSGLGLETMNALASNGAHIIGLARTLSAATAACKSIGLPCTPIECDLASLESVSAAARDVLDLGVPLDGLIANAGVAHPGTLELRHGVEQQFQVNYLGHFALINALCGSVIDGRGRIVMVTADLRDSRMPDEGIMFDNLDGSRFYDPRAFYAQSKLALAIYAKELSRRLGSRGIAVNSVHPGATRGTRLERHRGLPILERWSPRRLLRNNVQRGAATQVFVAASPSAAGLTGEHWGSSCRIASSHSAIGDAEIAQRLWDLSDIMVSQASVRAKAPLAATKPLAVAA